MYHHEDVRDSEAVYDVYIDDQSDWQPLNDHGSNKDHKNNVTTEYVERSKPVLSRAIGFIHNNPFSTQQWRICIFKKTIESQII